MHTPTKRFVADIYLRIMLHVSRGISTTMARIKQTARKSDPQGNFALIMAYKRAIRESREMAEITAGLLASPESTRDNSETLKDENVIV